MNTLPLLFAFTGALLLPGCGSDASPAQRTPPAHNGTPKVAGAPADLAVPLDSALLEDVQQQVLAQLHTDPLVGNVGHDFAHVLAIYQRGILAGARVELREGHDPALLKIAAAVQDQAQRTRIAADQLAQRLHGQARNYHPDDLADPFTRSIRGAVKTSFQAHPVAQVPDHDFAALLLAQRSEAAAIARAALGTGRLPAPARALARQVLTEQPTETRLLRAALKNHGAAR